LIAYIISRSSRLNCLKLLIQRNTSSLTYLLYLSGAFRFRTHRSIALYISVQVEYILVAELLSRHPEWIQSQPIDESNTPSGMIRDLVNVSMRVIAVIGFLLILLLAFNPQIFATLFTLLLVVYMLVMLISLILMLIFSPRSDQA
ncbi:MAG: hypothetical protein M3Q44_06980, partial [bacterium]|nr:hypothetical protein [bacterium]